MNKKSLILISILSIMQLCLIQKAMASPQDGGTAVQQKKELIIKEIDSKQFRQAAAFCLSIRMVFPRAAPLLQAR